MPVNVLVQETGAHPCVDVGGDVRHKGNNAREHRGEGVVDGCKDLAAGQHAGGAALRDKDAPRRQLWLHHSPVKVLRVQLLSRQPHTALSASVHHCVLASVVSALSPERPGAPNTLSYTAPTGWAGDKGRGSLQTW